MSATIQVSSTPSVAATPNVATTAKATSTAKVASEQQVAQATQYNKNQEIANKKFKDSVAISDKAKELLQSENNKSITDLGGCIIPPKPGVVSPNEKQIDNSKFGKIDNDLGKHRPDTEEKEIDKNKYSKINTVLSKFAMKKAYC